MIAASLLERHVDCGDVRIAGGDGKGDGGYIDSRGDSHGHYWVELTVPTLGEMIADITADQFGECAIALLPAAEARERYQPGCPEIIARHVADLSP